MIIIKAAESFAGVRFCAWPHVIKEESLRNLLAMIQSQCVVWACWSVWVRVTPWCTIAFFSRTPYQRLQAQGRLTSPIQLDLGNRESHLILPRHNFFWEVLALENSPFLLCSNRGLKITPVISVCICCHRQVLIWSMGGIWFQNTSWFSLLVYQMMPLQRVF